MPGLSALKIYMHVYQSAPPTGPMCNNYRDRLAQNRTEKYKYMYVFPYKVTKWITMFIFASNKRLYLDKERVKYALFRKYIRRGPYCASTYLPWPRTWMCSGFWHLVSHGQNARHDKKCSICWYMLHTGPLNFYKHINMSLSATDDSFYTFNHDFKLRGSCKTGLIHLGRTFLKQKNSLIAFTIYSEGYNIAFHDWGSWNGETV